MIFGLTPLINGPIGDFISVNIALYLTVYEFSIVLPKL